MQKRNERTIVWARSLMVLALAVMVSGCAASRSVVSLDQPSGTIPNPERGTTIKIVKVSDARTFEASPKNPDTPSLGGQDVNDSSLTARAIGRKRSGFGAAMGDVLLPEGQTVSDMMASTLTTGFRQANYRVLSPGDSGYETAVPVKARIVQFWSWFQPGFWEVEVHNRAEVELTGSLPVLKNGLMVRSEAKESMMAVTESDWQSIASEGLKTFSGNLVKALAGKPNDAE